MLFAAPAEARDFQSRCAEALGSRPGTVLVAEADTGRLLAVVHPALADRPVPPGSVFKLVSALAALESGRAGGRTLCRGAYQPLAGGPRLSCWKPGGHGALTLEEAIAHSCNAGFYQIGERTGAEALLATARRAGFGLAPGRLPERAAPQRLPGLAVGEGDDIAVTPRQMAGFAAAIATDGRLRAVDWSPGPLASRPFAALEHLERLRSGMRGSVLFGSSRGARLATLAIAGKTGTATYTDGSNRTYGWFVGYAPVERPQVVVVVRLDDANGFADAAPLARRVFAAWAEGRP